MGNGSQMAKGVADLVLGVRRIPWLQRLEDPPAPTDDLVPVESRG